MPAEAAAHSLPAVARASLLALLLCGLLLAGFFRKSLKQPSTETTLDDELEHVEADLRIELPRFADRLRIYLKVQREDGPEIQVSLDLDQASSVLLVGSRF